MKKIFLIVIATILSLSVFCNPVSKKDAVKTANTFIENNNLQIPSVSKNDIVYISTFNDTPALYVFSINNEGFIIVSAQDFTYPILGYSENGGFNPDNMPDNLKEVLLGYTQEIEFGVKNNIVVNSVIQKAKDDQLNGVIKNSKTVEPLLGDIKWDQLPYYNDMCPYDSFWGVKCPVGCAATAMVQIMRYWEHPAQGEGSNSYSSSYGTLSADFTCTYDWANMPKPTLTGPNQECAKASYHCAVSINMNFGPNGSGAYVEDVAYSLKNYFKYDNGINVKQRSGYTESLWKQMIKEELDSGRPLEYAGFDAYYTSGHAFVLDGYNSSDFFHFNWGWSGSYDGYFSINSLVPGGTGAGGGAGDFSYGQHAIFGIKPLEEVAVDVPTNLNATEITSQSAKLSWDEVELADSYKVQYKKETSSNWRVYTADENNITISNLESETDYVWRVKSIYGDQQSDYSEIDSFTTLELTCDPVENLQATVTDNKVKLSWELPNKKSWDSISESGDYISDKGIKFNIYKDNSYITTISSYSFTDRNVEVGTHNYCIEAVYSESCISDQVCVDATIEEVDACTPVQNLKAVNVDQTNVIKLTWDIPEGAKDRALVSYKIYFDGEEIDVINNVMTTEYVDESLSNLDVESDYTVNYCVKAIYSTCESDNVCVDVDVLTGISDISNLSIYPNPASSVVTISGVNVKAVRVYNNIGQLVKIVYGNVLDVSSLRDGIYMLNVVTEDGNFYKSKLVVN